MGVTYLRLRQYDNAIAAFKSVTAIKHDYAKAYANLAICYEIMGKGEEARAASNAARALTSTARSAEWESRVEKALNREVSLDFADTPFLDLLAFISTLTDVTITCDPLIDTRKLGTITIKERDIPLRQALAQACSEVSVAYVLKDGGIVISLHAAKGEAQPKPMSVNVAQGSFDARAQRAKLVGTPNGQTEASEQAVEAGLRWLALRQLSTGAWRTDSDLTRWADPGVTGLAMLAFLGAGYAHQEGKYRQTVSRAIAYIKREQDTEGCIGRMGDRRRTGHMYNHGICTLALVEAYAMTKDQGLKEPAERAVDFISVAQNTMGGWRYYFNSADGDSSVSGWMVSALHAARLAKLHVPDKTLTGARKFFASVTNKEKGYTSYMAGLAPSSAALVAVGLLCNQYLGVEGDDPYIKLASHAILKFPPKWVELTKDNRLDIENLATREPGANDYYFWYYASLALHIAQDDHWAKWYPQVRDILVKHQEQQGANAGSWPPSSRWALRAGRVYSTAMAILALETCYRYTYSGHVPAATDGAKQTPGR